MRNGRHIVFGRLILSAGILTAVAGGACSSERSFADASQRSNMGAGDSLGVAAFRVQLAPGKATSGKTMITGPGAGNELTVSSVPNANER